MEPTPRCFTVFSAVFLGAVSWTLPLTSAEYDSHPNAASFDCAAWTHSVSFSQSSWRHRLPSPALPLPHSQTTEQQQDNRDSLGTVVSETATMVSLSAPPTECHEQLAHSRTAGMIWSRSCNIHLFPINNSSLDTDPYLPPPPALALRWNVKKTQPPTELQIPATVTTLPLIII